MSLGCTQACKVSCYEFLSRSLWKMKSWTTNWRSWSIHPNFSFLYFQVQNMKDIYILFKHLRIDAISLCQWAGDYLQGYKTNKQKQKLQMWTGRWELFSKSPYCKGLREGGKKTWKLMSCEMIAMEGDILKCSKICIFALVSRVMMKYWFKNLIEL